MPRFAFAAWVLGWARERFRRGGGAGREDFAASRPLIWIGLDACAPRDIAWAEAGGLGIDA